MYDAHDGMRTKVLAELMHHMIGLHGKESHSSALPAADGLSKHDPIKHMEGVSVVKAGPIHDEPDMNEHGAEGEVHEVGEHDLGDLFGRKKKSNMVEF